MSADGSVELIWGDGPNIFRLAIGQFRELQDKVNTRRLSIGASPVGPLTLLKALQANDAWPDDARDVLRIGLVGGGKTVERAHRMMTLFFDPTPPLTHMRAAHAVLLAGLVGSPDEPMDSKKKIETEAAGTSRSDLPLSTEPAAQ